MPGTGGGDRGAQLRVAGGCLALLVTAWVALRGRVWFYDPYDAHRLTARAMLEGSLAMRTALSHTAHDEQVWHGAVYTNWGFGVPLLQAPFHALAVALHACQGFVPDRAIYFAYLALAMPVVWLGLDRALARVRPDVEPRTRAVVSWAATWMLLQVAVFPLMEGRFVIFEATLAYMGVAELVALGAYLVAKDGWKTGAVVATGVAAGIGLVVRPVGLLYVAVWAALLALEARPRWSRLAAYSAGVLPFGVFWLASNAARSGSLLGLGYANSNPGWDIEMPILRFGSRCIDSPAHFVEAAGSLFAAFFLLVTKGLGGSWLRACNFLYEERDGTGEPYFGPLVLILMGVVVAGVVRGRGRGLSPWVPLVAMTVLFFAFVRRGEGFAYRYVLDFWPLVALAVVQHVESLPRERVRVTGRTAGVLVAIGVVAMIRYLGLSNGGPTGHGYPDALPASDAASIAADWAASRTIDPPYPSMVTCATLREQVPYNNGKGWKQSCAVATFTNVYLGVPPRDGERHVLRFGAEGTDAQAFPVYVDGRVVTARRQGDAFDADVIIDPRVMASPVVVVTVLWTREPTPPPVRLEWIELT